MTKFSRRGMRAGNRRNPGPKPTYIPRHSRPGSGRGRSTIEISPEEGELSAALKKARSAAEAFLEKHGEFQWKRLIRQEAFGLITDLEIAIEESPFVDDASTEILARLKAAWEAQRN